jgi:hypothetical protein
MIVVVTVVVTGSLVCLCLAIFRRISDGGGTVTVFGVSMHEHKVDDDLGFFS